MGDEIIQALLVSAAVVPELLDDLVAADGLVKVGGQEGEQAALGTAEFPLLAAISRQGMRRGIEQQAAEADARGGGKRRVPLDVGEQLLHAEGFLQVGDPAGFQRPGDVVAIGMRRDKKDRDIRQETAEPGGDLDPVARADRNSRTTGPTATSEVW